jgi:hypothetical protein
VTAVWALWHSGVLSWERRLHGRATSSAVGVWSSDSQAHSLCSAAESGPGLKSEGFERRGEVKGEKEAEECLDAGAGW